MGIKVSHGSALTKISEVENECTLHRPISIVLAIRVPKIIEVGRNLTKL